MAGLRILPPVWRLKRMAASAALPAGAVLVCAGIWEIASRRTDLLYLPGVSRILTRLWELLVDGTFFSAMGATMVALVAGLAISVVLGIAIGMAMGLSPRIRAMLDVYFDALMSAPVIAFVPLFILIFGLGFPTRVAAVVLFALPPIVINTMTGISGTSRDLLEMARSFGATPWQVIWQVRLPQAYRHIEAGLSVGAARGVDGVITGEVLIAAVGLGGLITRFGNSFTMDKLYATVIVIVVLVALAGWLARLPGRLVPGHGQRSQS